MCHYSKLFPVEPAIFAVASLLVTPYSLHAIDLPLIAIDFSRVFILVHVLAKSLSIQKFILGKVFLKSVVKVAPSLQRPASARQVKISNHTMIVPSQLPPKKQLPIR